MNFSKLFAVLALAALAGVFSSCGDDSASDATATQATTTAAASGKYEIGPLEFPAKGPDAYRIRGYREDIPAYGVEASEEELRQAATYVHGYGVGRLEEDWPKACRYASESMVRRQAAVVGLPKGSSCEEVLERIPDIVLGSEYERTEVEANSLRVEGKKGYLLYHGGAAPNFMPVIEEDGVWKVNSRAYTPFYYSEN